MIQLEPQKMEIHVAAQEYKLLEAFKASAKTSNKDELKIIHFDPKRKLWISLHEHLARFEPAKFVESLELNDETKQYFIKLTDIVPSSALKHVHGKYADFPITLNIVDSDDSMNSVFFEDEYYAKRETFVNIIRNELNTPEFNLTGIGLTSDALALLSKTYTEPQLFCFRFGKGDISPIKVYSKSSKDGAATSYHFNGIIMPTRIINGTNNPYFEDLT